ncbi:hypothetical protein DRN73_07710, partial [Candidatus Pacearchaeota archaeon]
MMKLLRKLQFMAIIFLLVGMIFSFPVFAKPSIDVSVSVSPSTIKVGEIFTVRVKIKNTDPDEDIETNDDIRIKIYKEDVLIHDDEYNVPNTLSEDESYDFNISSNQFRVDGDDVWSRNIMDYECEEDQEIRVEVSGDV